MKPYISILTMACIIFCALSGCKQDTHTASRIKEATQLFEEGKIKEKAGKMDSAIICYRTSIDLLEHCDTCKLKIEVYQQLASILWLYRYYDRSIETYRTAYRIAEKFDDKTYVSSCLRGIGICFLLNNQTDSALYYVNMAYHYIPEIRKQEEIASIYNNLSAIYSETKNYRQAMAWNQKAITYNTNANALQRNYAQQANLHLILNQLDSAYYYAQLALESTDPYTRVSCLETLFGVACKNQSPDSIQYYTQLTHLSDSLWRENKAVEIGEAEIILKQQQMTKGIQQVMTKRRVIFWMLVLITAAYASYRLFRFIRKKHRITEKGTFPETYPTPVQQPEQTAGTVPPPYNQEMLIKKGSMMAELFKNSLSYQKLIQKMEKEESFTYQEQFEFIESVEQTFDSFIDELTAIYRLTKEESVLCCLALTGLSNRQCATCKNVSENAIRTQKSRIKSKITQQNPANGKFFDTIFRKSSTRSS